MEQGSSALPPADHLRDHTIKLKWLLWAVAILMLAGFAAWAWTAWDCSKRQNSAAQMAAANEARAIAVLGGNAIKEKDWAVLQSYVDNLVSHKPFSYIAIVNKDNVAVVHTDRGQLGNRFRKPGNMVSALVPVMGYTEQIARVWVGAEKR